MNKHETFKDFYKQFIEECKLARNEGKFLTCAFIGYDYTNPGIIKMLKDQEYWNGLDELTGDKIALFYLDSIKHQRSKYNMGSNPKVQKKTKFSKLKKLNKLIVLQLPSKESPSTVNKCLLEKLGYNKYTEPNIPFILFVRVKDDEIIDRVFIDVEYNKETEIDAYTEFAKAIKDILNQICRMNHINNPGDEALFDIIKKTIVGSKRMKVIKRITQKVLWIKNNL